MLPILARYGDDWGGVPLRALHHTSEWQLLAANAKGNHTLPVMMAGFVRAVLGDGTRSKPTADVMLGSLTTFHHLMDIRDALQTIPCWALKVRPQAVAAAARGGHTECDHRHSSKRMCHPVQSDRCQQSTLLHGVG